MNLDKLKSTKNIYNVFLEDMKNSDIANSPKRYIMELNILKEILKQAQACNLSEEIEKYSKKVNEINKKLEDEFKLKLS
jgi:hypothetical protein